MLAVQEKKKLTVLYLVTGVFLMLSFFFMIKKDFYWFFFLPLLLAIVYYYVVSLDKVLLFIAFITPLAVNISVSGLGSSLSVPAEPLLAGVLLLFIINILIVGEYDKKAATHPVSYMIYFYLIWMTVTTLTSSNLMVSLKHLISRIWFIVPFYFLGIPLFRKEKNIYRFIGLYGLGLVLVVFYTWWRHAPYGFGEDAGHWVMTPFYNDHTAYGAALALFIPVFISFIFFRNVKPWIRILSFMVSLILLVAIVLSYSRAAWLGLAGAILVLLLVWFKVKFKWVLFALLISASTLMIFQQQILDQLEKNKQDSSSNYYEHIRSMTNISSDASNLERLNRWSSAIRMFDARPFLGWGPGTYQFVYAPFQLSRERTVISTNTGDRGTAHSEYLGPLSEEGIFGLLSVLILFGYIVYTGLRVYKIAKGDIRVLSIGVTLALITYFIHGFLNNFLSTDKLAVPVWGFMAILVAIDIYYFPEKEKAGKSNLSGS